MDLSVMMEKDLYAPGEPAILKVVLINKSEKPIQVLELDRASLKFMVRPAAEGGEKQLRFVSPVSSRHEITELYKAIPAEGLIERRFLFSTLTMERGNYVLMAQYTMPNPKDLRVPVKEESRPMPFSVKGEKVYAHRYLNGRLTRADAVKLAKSELGDAAKVAETDAKTIIDEAGFFVWWVNLELESDSEEPQKKSYFVCPYMAQVISEAKPFVRKDDSGELPYPKTSRIFEKFRQRTHPKE
ncbi:MAG: hypothetical protein ACLFUS_05740 [Candidatus Sumerlaeia bacterium]